MSDHPRYSPAGPGPNPLSLLIPLLIVGLLASTGLTVLSFLEDWQSGSNLPWYEQSARKQKAALSVEREEVALENARLELAAAQLEHENEERITQAEAEARATLIAAQAEIEATNRAHKNMLIRWLLTGGTVVLILGGFIALAIGGKFAAFVARSKIEARHMPVIEAGPPTHRLDYDPESVRLLVTKLHGSKAGEGGES